MSSDAAIVAGVRAQWEQGLFLDLTIEVDSHSLKVNKSIMSAVSDYFHAMVTAGMDESQKDSVKLEAVSLLAMEHLINFIYKGQIGLTKTNVADILQGAVYLQMHSAITACTDFILENLDATLCYEVLSVFQNYSLQDGINKIRAYIKDNLMSIAAECDPNVISYDECCFIINNWQDHEVDLFYFVKKWLDADHEKRNNHLMDLMSCIRFCLITFEDLRTIAKRYLICFDSSGKPKPWTPMVENALEYSRLPVHRRVLDNSEQTKVRCEPMLTVFCAEYDPSRSHILDADKQWKKRSGFSISSSCFEPFASVEVNNFLVVACYDPHPARMMIFDPRTSSWTEVAQRDVDKEDFAMVYHAGYVYILGGIYVSPRGLDTVERYDFQTDTWSSFTTLPSTRLYHAACTYEDLIYVSGGQHIKGCESLKNVDCLNLKTMEWQSKAPMLEAQSQHKMLTMKLNGKDVLCVLGQHLRLDYYDSTSDQWCRFNFSSEYTQLVSTKSGALITKGNTLYFIDNHCCGAWNNLGACLEFTFPENGKEVTVNKIKHFSQKPRGDKESFGLCGAVMGLPAYKYRRQRWKELF